MGREIITLASHAKNLSGLVFGRLAVVAPIGRDKARKHVIWLCQCECGSNLEVLATSLQSGHTRSCGCYRRELSRQRLTTHDMTSAPEYRVWTAMKARCNTPNDKAYKNYGARGITVCSRWDQFENFFEDMGAKPSSTHSIDRIDNNLGYWKKNCRWATARQQNNNKGNNHVLAYNGQALTLAQWSRRTGIHEATIRSRVRAGWSLERSLTGLVA